MFVVRLSTDQCWLIVECCEDVCICMNVFVLKHLYKWRSISAQFS
jgi:hypothetical protein